jgi:hypothetical protein
MRKASLLAVLVATQAMADPIWPVRPEPGLACMAVTSPGVQILAQPHPAASALATAGPLVFAVQPQKLSNGYVEIERPNKEPGWIQQDALSPGPANCVPTLMSNGLILIGGPG